MQNSQIRQTYTIFKVLEDGQYERCTHSILTKKLERLLGFDIPKFIEMGKKIAMNNSGFIQGYYYCDHSRKRGGVFPGHDFKAFLEFIQIYDKQFHKGQDNDFEVDS